MDSENMDRVIKTFKERDDFLITAHINPEGDSIGSQLAIHYILKKLGKNAVIANHDDVPENLKFLPGAGSIMSEVPKGFLPATVIILDCPVKERTGNICKEINEEQFIVNIDHHVSNGLFGDINWVESDASSVGEMIFHMIKKLGIGIEKNLAVVIYTAILTDTGMFNYDNTSPETHRVAGELISAGVRPKEIHREIFERKALSEIRLLGEALTTLQVEEGGKLAHMILTRKMYREEGVENISTDEFINFPRSIKGVEVAVFFKEDVNTRDKVNVNFRSSGKVNVNAVASRFGGGGHEQAAGCVLNCGLVEAQDKVLAEAKKAIQEAG
jgi:phosphoesterase RecJ-like protein